MNNFETILKTIVAIAGGILTGFFGGYDKLLNALLIFMAIDYITGILKARYTKTISSRIGFEGIIKKVMILTIVVLANTLQTIIAENIPLRDIVLMFFIANEGISILENTSTIIPVPDKIKEVLEQLKN